MQAILAKPRRSKPRPSRPKAKEEVKTQGQTLKAVYGPDFLIENEEVPEDMQDLLGRV